MDTRKIGSLDVSLNGLGCNNFGRDLDERATTEIVRVALHEGITFFDTADGYGRPRGTSEAYLGRALGSLRDQVVIATKFGSRNDDEHVGGSPANVRFATEASLRRLGTDRIDLLQLHRPDPRVPIAETLGALADLVREGKVREIGCSNFSRRQLQEASDAVAPGSPGFVSVQNEYSLMNRFDEVDVIPTCRELGVAYLPYFPLYAGLLTGKYRRGEGPPPNSRMVTDFYAPVRDVVFSDSNFDTLEKLTDFAEARGHTILELAFAWLLSQDTVPSVIAGVSSPSQVRSNIAASRWRLSEVDRRAIDELVPPPQNRGTAAEEHLFASYF